jgi:membrane-associated phospholipid phosphatase
MRTYWNRRHSLHLPAIATARGKAVAAVGTALIAAVMYYLPQYLHRGDPVILPMTIVDTWMPFWPISGLVYFSVFPLLLGTYAAIDDLEEATRFLYASLLAQTIAMTAFLLWPTRYPRELYALPADAGVVGGALVSFCHTHDAALNCLPSLHVSTVVLCVCALRTHRMFAPALLGGTLLIGSTLTFKQHYFLDVVAGLVLGLFAAVVFLRRPDTGTHWLRIRNARDA